MYDRDGGDVMEYISNVDFDYIMKKYHPDRLVKYSEEERVAAQEKFIEIQKAYEEIKSTW